MQTGHVTQIRTTCSRLVCASIAVCSCFNNQSKKCSATAAALQMRCNGPVHMRRRMQRHWTATWHCHLQCHVLVGTQELPLTRWCQYLTPYYSDSMCAHGVGSCHAQARRSAKWRRAAVISHTQRVRCAMCSLAAGSGSCAQSECCARFSV
jgi:hypothetical protein